MPWFPDNIHFKPTVSIALIIEFVETDNRKLTKNNNFHFEVIPRSLECCYLQIIYWHYRKGNMQNLMI